MFICFMCDTGTSCVLTPLPAQLSCSNIHCRASLRNVGIVCMRGPLYLLPKKRAREGLKIQTGIHWDQGAETPGKQEVANKR